MPGSRLTHVRFLVLAALLLAPVGCQPPGDLDRPPQDNRLSAAALNQDLDQFQRELEERFAYLRANHADYRGAIAAVRERAREGMTAAEFGSELLRVCALFIDCHGTVQGFALPPGYLPFRIGIAGDRAVAFLPDRSAFVEPSFPFISGIDGRSMAEWADLLRPIIPRGSPQFVRSRMLHYLETIQFARGVAGMAPGSSLAVELESRDRRQRTARSLAVAANPLGPSRWPSQPSRILAANVAYLRIHDWDGSGGAEISRWMPRFAGCTGLIVDIRDNPGGSRNVGERLFAYLARAAGKPRVANASRYRLYREFGDDYLESRNMYKQDWSGWSAEEREAIAGFKGSFRPEWRVPEDEFSDWHYWLPRRRQGMNAYDFFGPVVFLMNEGCFSASDVTLASVKGLPNVTLIGGPSGGGSGAPVFSTLANSGIRPYLSSMASFQRSGLLFDGHGVEPDIPLQPEPDFFLVDGPDTVLEFAVRWILQQ